MPSARAACTASRSAPAMPAAVAVRIAGSASRVSTNTVLPKPVPSNSTTSTSRPRLGMARAPLVSPMTRNDPRPVWPTTMPSGMAMMAPRPTAATV